LAAFFLADPHCNGEDLPGPCRESVTAKIPPIMRLNIGGPELGHRVLLVRVRMNMDESRLIARFQRSTTELLIEKRLGRALS